MAGRRELRRYSRHLLIPEVGLEGQEKLARARVLAIGAGGLGSPVLAYLAAAGVGRIIVIDDDTVDVTNLQRQILYDTADVGDPKSHTASERLRGNYPEIANEALATR
jgi:molybdopterin/thiamine biosynthesis adenylyltransferase